MAQVMKHVYIIAGEAVIVQGDPLPNVGLSDLYTKSGLINTEEGLKMSTYSDQIANETHGEIVRALASAKKSTTSKKK